MQVELHKGKQLIAVLNDDTIILGSLPIDPGMHFHVKDDFISNIDLQEVEKFQLSEDQYEQMDNTLRNFLRKNRLGKYNEEEFKVEEEKRLEKFRLEKAKAKLCPIGSRCEVNIYNLWASRTCANVLTLHFYTFALAFHIETNVSHPLHQYKCALKLFLRPNTFALNFKNIHDKWSFLSSFERLAVSNILSRNTSFADTYFFNIFFPILKKIVYARRRNNKVEALTREFNLERATKRPI